MTKFLTVEGEGVLNTFNTDHNNNGEISYWGLIRCIYGKIDTIGYYNLAYSSKFEPPQWDGILGFSGYLKPMNDRKDKYRIRIYDWWIVWT